MIVCAECHEEFPDSQTQCTHCGRPSLFPNVTAALRAEERDEVRRRYMDACSLVATGHADAVRDEFESVIRSKSHVVISVSFNEVERLATADCSVFSTYYQRIRAGLQVQTGGKWDVLRGVVEHAVFPGYKDHIRFGSLSLDGTGVKNYGNCWLVLKPNMVTHRTTLFEDNNVVFTAYDQEATMRMADQLEPGHRAVWEDREKLCVAKLAPRLRPDMTEKDFTSLVLEQGQTTAEDRFVELHVWGSLTIRSVERIRIHRKQNRPLKAAIADLEDRLKRFQIPIETV